MSEFCEDIVPLSDLKVNPGWFVNQVEATHRPVLLTNRGCGVAVVQLLKDYVAGTEERAFMKGVLKRFSGYRRRSNRKPCGCEKTSGVLVGS